LRKEKENIKLFRYYTASQQTMIEISAPYRPLACEQRPGEDRQKYGGLTSLSLMKIMIVTVNPGI